ncbi:GNAT family N-acetyltransferase [Paenibacillus lemnae]|uniref:GNAT family N-acetyltransferase n=1 Tax=Paenibacillus lemnae TaxID=1330551 RepID=A0A848M4A9_PAELE|nr:GNAT family N-acetyltransferase [Paenibacillus lemnae]NMO95767.1 GNAT family N-acetyltransferase [Paenibacillus lemnae]
MFIRQAQPADAQAAARLLYDALHDVAHQLTGMKSEEDVIRVLVSFFEQEEGRLGYRQALICEVEGTAVGIVISYGGSESAVLDRPILNRLRMLKQDSSLTLDPEADHDEFYIDTLSVSAEFAGRGIGTALMNAAKERAKEQGFFKIALAVARGNQRAHDLYLRNGYKSDKEIMINGHPYAHMVKWL